MGDVGGAAEDPPLGARREDGHGRFGRETLDREGLTADLSHGGLFVATERPLPTDSPIKLRLHLDGYSVPLSGRVAWSRAQREEGRPPGMGVQLIHAPPMYRRYVDELMESAAADSKDGHETEK